jgi:DNA-binding transcriptional MerR regulator/methylmalonyl-CoA mutase cobalamin-binding subunit
VVAGAQLRIGELARRTGTSREVLRAWEQRYGLFTPVRSPGGYRLYSANDELRVRRMQERIADGLSAAQAARAVRAAPESEDALERLDDAFGRFDAAGAEELLDRLFAARTTGEVVLEVVLPLLHRIGERWETAEHEVAREHFASNIVGGRLLGLARGWDGGDGPRAVLACPSGEEHDLGLIAFGLALREHGWRIVLLGRNTPPDIVARAADGLRPEAVVLAAVLPHRLDDVALRALGDGRTLAIGGPGATAADAERLGAVLLEGDPVAAAAQLAGAATAA